MRPNDSREEFIETITRIILENLSDENFRVKDLVNKSQMSRYRFNKKLFSFTGKNINKFIREVRLQKALELLLNEDLTISELAYKTGFSSPAYFNKCFHDYFGYPPGQAKLNRYDKPTEKADYDRKKKLPRSLKYMLAGVIMLLLVSIALFSPRIITTKGPGKPAIAVMPFENLTNDAEYDYCERAIRRDMITALSMTGELEVRMEESVDNLLKKSGILNISGYPSAVRSISKKLKSDYYITGSIQKFGTRIRLDANLIETKGRIVGKSFEVTGDDENEVIIITLIDSLRRKVTDYMLISRIIKKNPYYQHLFTSPSSLEALKYFDNTFKSENAAEDIKWLRKALKEDSTFSDAALALEYAYSANNQPDSSRIWLIKNFRNRYSMADPARLKASWAYAFSFESYDEQIRYLKELSLIDSQEPDTHYLLGLIYCLSGEYDNAIPELEKSFKILKKWGKDFLKDPGNCSHFKWLGIAYHNSGQIKKEARFYRNAEQYIKGHPWFDMMQANLDFTDCDTAAAMMHLENAKIHFKELLNTDDKAFILAQTGRYFQHMANYDLAEIYYRRALDIEPDNLEFLSWFSDLSRKSNKYDQKFIKRAMDLTKDKQAYCEFMTDLGMDLFKQGKCKEAIDLVQKAWDEAPFKVYYIRESLESLLKGDSNSF